MHSLVMNAQTRPRVKWDFSDAQEQWCPDAFPDVTDDSYRWHRGLAPRCAQ